MELKQGIACSIALASSSQSQDQTKMTNSPSKMSCFAKCIIKIYRYISIHAVWKNRCKWNHVNMYKGREREDLKMDWFVKEAFYAWNLWSKLELWTTGLRRNSHHKIHECGKCFNQIWVSLKRIIVKILSGLTPT